MSQMPGPYPENIHEIVGQLASQGKIDPVENIKRDKVYIWHGTQDSVVPFCEYFSFLNPVPVSNRICKNLVFHSSDHLNMFHSRSPYGQEILQSLPGVWQQCGDEAGWQRRAWICKYWWFVIWFGDNILFQPSSDQGGECGQMNSPNYVNNCNYDGAYNVLTKVYIIVVCGTLNDKGHYFRPWDQFKIKTQVKILTNMIWGIDMQCVILFEFLTISGQRVWPESVYWRGGHGILWDQHGRHGICLCSWEVDWFQQR